MKSFAELQEKLTGVWPLLDERTRRLTAANEARALGRGGISQV
ncbi:MAG: ISAzo13 family transposase, partial [Desulfatitalea sp.]